MMYCPKCGNSVRDGKFCANCGHELLAETINDNQNHKENITDNNQAEPNVVNNYQQENDVNNINRIPEFNSPVVQQENNIQTRPTQNLQTQQEYNQSNYTQYNYQQNYQQPPIQQKSKLLGFILGFFIPGLGYGYVNKWADAIAIFIGYWVCIFLSFLIIPLFIAVILWIYSLYKTNDMIDKYNKGLPY